jgi:hypothetical protein
MSRASATVHTPLLGDGHVGGISNSSSSHEVTSNINDNRITLSPSSMHDGNGIINGPFPQFPFLSILLSLSLMIMLCRTMINRYDIITIVYIS